jgi:hypothetical protein
MYAPEVDDALTGGQGDEMKKESDPREGLNRPHRNSVQLGRWVPEPLRQCSTHLEMEVTVGVLGHLAVHVLHLAFQLLDVDCRHDPFLSA